MTTLREAAEQALEALDYCIEHSAEIVAERAKDRGQGSDDLQMMMVEYLEKHRCVITTLRAALAQEQTLEQEPSNPKEKEMTDPNSVSFNLNTDADALPVEWLRLDGTGFHYKGKVIEALFRRIA